MTPETMDATSARRAERRALMPGGPRRAPTRPSWKTRVPELLVLVSLLGILVFPVLAQRRIDRLRVYVNDAAEPARSHVAEIKLALALEAAGRRGYLLTGDAELRTSMRDSRARRLAAERSLVDEARAVGGDAPAAAAVLVRRLREIDAHLDTILAGGASSAAYVSQIAGQRHRFDAALVAADSVSSVIGRDADRRRRQIRSTERAVGLLIAALVLLALTATFLVVRLRRAAESRQREVERVTESRTRLVRGFTHDVKNPLGAADGFLALLEDGVYGPLGERQIGAVAKGRRAIGQALDLIASLLEIARAESGRLELHLHPTDVSGVVGDLVDAFRAQAEAKGLALRAELAEDLPRVDTDDARLRQVVGNLVSNAIKYTAEGGHVTVTTSLSRALPTREVVVEVVDDGPGIAPEQLERLFLEFTRFDPNAAEGAGIGLAISQRIAGALGGRIDVRSQIGEGSVFALRLPVEE